MNLAEFHYDLPEHLIAQEPAVERDGARMLVVDRASGSFQDLAFRNFPDFISPGDCLVVNDSRVLPSRLFGRKTDGEARVQIFLVEQLTDDALTWKALVRPGRKVRTGDVVHVEGGLRLEVTDWGEHGERTVRFLDCDNLLDRLEEIGHIPLPPYIHRPDRADDRERDQTVYARERGSVAAPSAGLHFTEDVMDRVRTAGGEIARATLHVGLGTFRSIETDTIEEHRMHSETYRMDPGEWKKVEASSRTVAVGTTSVRTVETISRTGELAGDTDIFIYPGYRFQRVGALLTNFHLPGTTLLLLVCAFAGKDLAMAAYRHAIEQRYRFFSYGDCMLIV